MTAKKTRLGSDPLDGLPAVPAKRTRRGVPQEEEPPSGAIGRLLDKYQEPQEGAARQGSKPRPAAKPVPGKKEAAPTITEAKPTDKARAKAPAQASPKPPAKTPVKARAKAAAQAPAKVRASPRWPRRLGRRRRPRRRQRLPSPNTWRW